MSLHRTTFSTLDQIGTRFTRAPLWRRLLAWLNIPTP